MGAAGFVHYQGGDDMQAAFREALEDVLAEEGTCRGNVAAKDRAVQVHPQAVTLEEAYALAQDYQGRNVKDTDDKWGPAGAIPVRGGRRHVCGDLEPVEGGYAHLGEAALKTIESRGLLRAGERISDSVMGMTEQDRRGRVVSGHFSVEAQGGTGPEVTGWVFFGMAPE
jgi:hypothetical protein